MSERESASVNDTRKYLGTGGMVKLRRAGLLRQERDLDTLNLGCCGRF